jgi:hypothetical protein
LNCGLEIAFEKAKIVIVLIERQPGAVTVALLEPTAQQNGFFIASGGGDDGQRDFFDLAQLFEQPRAMYMVRHARRTE